MIAVFCVALSLLLAHSHSVQVNVQISLQHSIHHAVYRDKFMVPSLSRKLKLNGETTAKTFADKYLMPQKLLEDSSGEKIVDENENSARRGKGTETTVEDFAMDYHGVRRRRPIHNKQIPFVP